MVSRFYETKSKKRIEFDSKKYKGFVERVRSEYFHVSTGVTMRATYSVYDGDNWHVIPYRYVLELCGRLGDIKRTKGILEKKLDLSLRGIRRPIERD